MFEVVDQGLIVYGNLQWSRGAKCMSPTDGAKAPTVAYAILPTGGLENVFFYASFLASLCT